MVAWGVCRHPLTRRTDRIAATHTSDTGSLATLCWNTKPLSARMFQCVHMPTCRIVDKRDPYALP